MNFLTLLAQNDITNPPLSTNIRNLTGVEFLNRLVPNLISLSFIVAILVALIFLISGGIRWITSSGDKTANEEASRTITSAIVGLVIVFCLYVILKLISHFFGLDLITIDIGTLLLR